MLHFFKRNNKRKLQLYKKSLKYLEVYSISWKYLENFLEKGNSFFNSVEGIQDFKINKLRITQEIEDRRRIPKNTGKILNK